MSSATEMHGGIDRPGATDPSAGTTTARSARIGRREIHSPRSAAAITVAAVVIVLCGWLGTEMVLLLFGQPALLATPADLAAGVASASSLPIPLLGTIAAGCALLGLVLLIVAVAPGRRARHLINSERTVTVVDDEVIASAVARYAARVGGIDPDNTRVSVSRRIATVHLTPTSGQPVQQAAVQQAVREQLDGLQLRPALQTRVVVAVEGRVGA
ncbi:hypothetical protein E3T46_13000 [Cryobacterium sp. Hh11]|uniref:DUF6286 domain-containing protein n=1 Tax=Cryobacterium sp. Hh11 TaxID=2555868 RepID=UPI00106B030B|nr:DUF6286 domain-containing protein [Cryobacterium sp. Hh11]TFD49765.1 hypothetical protein E3T46_13000 [Cryobacterium sp. Hh11]